MAKYIFPTLLTAVSLSLLSGCVTQSFENNEPIVKNQANRDEMAATRVSLGLGYLKMGDMSQAKLNLEKAKRFSPNLVQVHTAFAHYYETVGEEELAIGSFEQALSIKADSADTLNNYGVFLCRQDKVAAAEVQFLKAIAVPSYLLVSQSYENLASCYLQSDDFEKAEMYLNKAIFHSPNRTVTLLQMVRLQYAMADYKEAKRFLQKFERNTQRFTADSLALAYKLYWKLGQRRTATNYANMLVKMYPQSWEGKQYLLNELEFIDSDDLARKYQISQKKSNKLSPSSNKRVVKLSPKKNKTSEYTSSVKVLSPSKVVNELPEVVKVTKQVSAAPVVATTSAVVATPQLATTATSSVLGSGAALVSAAVTGAVVAASKPIANNKEPVADNLAVTSDITKPENSSTISNPEKVDSLNKEAVEQNSALISEVEQGVSSSEIAVVTPVVTPVVTTEVVAAVTPAAKSESVVVVAAVTSQPINDGIEPTSTKPIPATRDVPLPEALPQQAEVIAEVDESEVAEKQVMKEASVLDSATTLDSTTEVAEEVIDDVNMVEAQDALHTVSSGDNLYNISVKYNVKLNTLRKWNDISEKNKIRIGDKLYVVDPQTVKNIND